MKAAATMQLHGDSPGEKLKYHFGEVLRNTFSRIATVSHYYSFGEQFTSHNFMLCVIAALKVGCNGNISFRIPY